jgi:hypothetical protein
MALSPTKERPGGKTFFHGARILPSLISFIHLMILFGSYRAGFARQTRAEILPNKFPELCSLGQQGYAFPAYALPMSG